MNGEPDDDRTARCPDVGTESDPRECAVSASRARPVRSVTCPGCGAVSRSRAMGGYLVTCFRCEHRHYLERAEATDTMHEREPLPIACRGCGHEWMTRARAQSAVRCPSCARSVWVPVTVAQVEPAPPAVSGPGWSFAPQEPELDGWEDEPAGPRLADAVRELAALFTAPQTRTPAKSAPPSRAAQTPPAGRPAGVSRPSAPRPPTSSAANGLPAVSAFAIGPHAVAAFRRIGLGLDGPAGPLLLSQQPGQCPVWNGRFRRYCGATVTHRAVFSDSAYAPVCEGHSYAVRTCSEERGVRVTVIPR